MLPEQQQRILGYFIEEAKDHLNTIEQGLLNLQSTLNDPEMVNEVFRAAHSIKGGAAMLGLSSIQHTSHRLEDCFKVLKDHPVQVDQKLESLFLGVSDTLKVLLENLQGPFGLPEETANDLMLEAEPVFEWLYEHLEVLVQQGGSEVTASTSATVQESYLTAAMDAGNKIGSPIPLASPVVAATRRGTLTPVAQRKNPPAVLAQQDRTAVSFGGKLPNLPFTKALSDPTSLQAEPPESDSEQQIQTQVIQTLREMLQLFKQSATPETRQNLQACCNYLARIGEESEWSHWANLCRLAGRAIANPENTYLTLAKIVIIEIKQALEFVLTGREAEIAISQQLESLIPLPEIELLEIELVHQPNHIPEPVLSASTFDTVSDDEAVLPITDNFTELAADTDLLEIQPQDSISSLSDLALELNSDSENDELIPESSLDPNCPEVGIAELNTLADLFEGETPDLDGTWQQVEILDISAAQKSGIDLSNIDTEDTDSEFEFLFEAETINHSIQETVKEEEFTLGQLFGDEFLEEENKETQNQEAVGLVIEFSYENLVEQDDATRKSMQLNSERLTANESLPAAEVNQRETESTVFYEPFTKDESGFDDLFTEVASSNPVAEIAPIVNPKSEMSTPKDEIVSLDDLFAESSDSHSSSLLQNHSSSSSVLHTSSITAAEFSLEQEDAFSHFWEQGDQKEKQSKLPTAVEEDAAKALEEILLAAATSDDIFGDTSLNLEDLDMNFQSEPLIFLSDTDDDLFEELSSTNSPISSNVDNGEVSPEILSSPQHGTQINPGNQSKTQPPEILEFMPEFTAPKEISSLSLPQPSTEIELDWFHAFEVENDESLPVLFEDVATVSSNNVELDNSTDNPFTVRIQDLDDDLFLKETSSEIMIFTDEPPQLQARQEVLDVETITNLQAVFDFTETISEISENVKPADPIDLGDDLLVTASDLQADDNFTKTDQLDGDNQEFLFNEFEDFLDSVMAIVGAEVTDVPDSLAKVLTTEAAITEAENSESARSTDSDTPVASTEEDTALGDFADFADLNQVSFEDSTLFSPTAKAEVEIIEDEDSVLSYIEAHAAQTETADNALMQDEFAELDNLLKQEVASSISAASMPEEEIAALEELLNFGQEQVKHVPPPGDINDQFKELVEMVKGDLPPRPPVTRSPRFEQLMKVPVKHLDDLSNLVGELVVNRNTLEQDQERLRQSLDNLLTQVQQLSDVGGRMQELYERSLLEASLLASRKSYGLIPHPDTDRGFSELEMDRFTPFHTLSQEIIELIVRVRESASDIDFVTEESEQVARQFRQITTQLQEGLTRSRMEPFAEVSTPLERGVRESAIKCGKQARLVIEGRDTLIDKMILEHLKTPLTHLLNNAIAHGIETPGIRQAAGKPPVGVISIRAFHQGNQTIISVRDDGAGIDSEGVKAKVINMGIMTSEQVKTMSNIDVYDLLFQPGFSTKDKEDEFAGRGVGLDVVLTRISEIRGTISIDSTLGKGTTFTIRLPLTLSICKALCCVSDKARIAFPMDGVEDTLDLPAKNIHTGVNGQKFIPWRDTLLPFRPLKELLTLNRQMSRASVYGGNRDDDMISAVVVRSANTLIALQIDQVLSEQEIVIKQFEGPAPKPIGVAGATILGDGRIMPIADVLEIIDIFQGRISTQRGFSPRDQKANHIVPEAPPAKIDPTVLIVDDSITVRELLSLTFNKAGYRVEQARDGQEAWDKLRSGLPCDIVFCDIEMPRCDGLELLSRIQKDPYLNHLPIAMLTSRGADKHRQMAVQLGASGYFTKPYLEEALLEAAGRMLKGEKLVSST